MATAIWFCLRKDIKIIDPKRKIMQKNKIKMKKIFNGESA